MVRSTLLSVNPLDGSKTYAHVDDVDGKVYFETAMDVQAILESCLLERNETERHTRWGDGRNIARIPLFILSELRRTHRGPEDNPLQFARWLDDNPGFKLRNTQAVGLFKEKA